MLDEKLGFWKAQVTVASQISTYMKTEVYVPGYYGDDEFVRTPSWQITSTGQPRPPLRVPETSDDQDPSNLIAPTKLPDLYHIEPLNILV